MTASVSLFPKGRCVVAAKLDWAQDGDSSDLLNQISPKPFSKEKNSFTGQYLEGKHLAY